VRCGHRARWRRATFLRLQLQLRLVVVKKATSSLRRLGAPLSGHQGVCRDEANAQKNRIGCLGNILLTASVDRSTFRVTPASYTPGTPPSNLQHLSDEPQLLQSIRNQPIASVRSTAKTPVANHPNLRLLTQLRLLSTNHLQTTPELHATAAHHDHFTRLISHPAPLRSAPQP